MADDAFSNTNSNDDHLNRDLSRLESKIGVTEKDSTNSSMSAEDVVVTEMILATERVQKVLMANNASDGDECDKQRADSNESSVPQPTSGVNSSPIQLSTESPIDQQQSQVSPPTTVNHQQQLREKKHIMISYNRATCTLICDKIENGLQKKGYTVWRDTKCLHGNILDGMAKAIENSFIVLLLMNTKYQESKYCMAEAEYAFEKNVPYIPCIMEEGFKPSGGLAILRRARNRISFFPSEDFDRSYAELVTEIEYIEAELNEKCHENLSDRINTIISDYKSSINKSHLQLQLLTKKELFKLMERLCKEIAPETLQIFQNENSYDNDDNSIQNQEKFYNWIMTYLLKQDERLTAIIRTQQEQEKNFNAVTQCLLHHNDEMVKMMQTQLAEHAIYSRQLSDQIVEQQKQITQIVERQQHQEATNCYLIRSLQTQSTKEQSTSSIDHDRVRNEKQDNQQGYIHTLINLANTTILLCTLGAILRKS